MKKENLSRAVMTGCVILIGASCLFAQEWPQWRGPKRDGKVRRFSTPRKWPKELTQTWKTLVGLGDATPALVRNKLYVFTRQGADEVTLCLNAANGKELWKDKYAAQEVTGAAARHPGPRSSPTVANRKVITLGVGGVLSCLDAANGKVVWRKDPFPKVVPRFFAGMSPIIVDRMVIAHLGGQDNGAIIAYDLATGNEKWRWSVEGPDYGSPALLTAAGTKQIAAPTEKSVAGIAVADGKLLWQLPSLPPRMAYNAATPIVDGQTVIYAAKGRGTKAVKIQKQRGGFTANELWSNAELGVQFSTPVLREGLLFGLSDRNFPFCINTQTGQTVWVDTTAYGSRGFGSIVDVGSHLIVLTNDSELIIFEPDGRAYSELTRYKVAETPTYAHPVITGNRVFVKDQESVTMFRLIGAR